jgi:protein transport protein SEC23
MAVPISCMYTPLKAVTGLATVSYPPLTCANKASDCGAVLNPYCRVDFSNKIWICPFCSTRNAFPVHYSEISTENRPAAIIPQYTTIEYILDTKSTHPPVFLFVLDTVVIGTETHADTPTQAIRRPTPLHTLCRCVFPRPCSCAQTRSWPL